MADTDRLAITPVQKVVVVDGNAEVLGMLEAVLDAGRYDMVFVESSDHAYSQIKKVLPNLVIVCARIEQLESFQLLTMLKLDSETREIPVLTVPLGEPVPGLPDFVVELLGSLELHESPLDMSELSRTFGVRTTSLHDFVRGFVVAGA